MREVVSINCVEDGGDAGGVSSCRVVGRGPGEQYGMCLLGTGAGVPRCDVLMESCGGGVGEAVRSRSTIGEGLASSVAIVSMDWGYDYGPRFVNVRS